eukprot:CAMPEP_0195103356 /NCGR_PEP_ID=MMETSP0448-20130528/71979_1 /TAXON_ID=66468 /ORGANISM="Heterocapsa triquestra, Strain CCMP 448" /LENGTH=52 /DNA_ID=CAMNT_0040139013 /DNA_START=54 /DNA_END=209 /DNA_ORIENTATION=+
MVPQCGSGFPLRARGSPSPSSAQCAHPRREGRMPGDGAAGATRNSCEWAGTQ